MSLDLRTILIILLVVAGAVGSYGLARYLLSRYALAFLRRMRPAWVGPTTNSHLLTWLAALAPLLIVSLSVPLLAGDLPAFSGFISVAVSTIGLVVLALLLNAGISIALDIYETHPLSKEVPLRGLAQLVKITVIVVGVLMAIAVMLGVPAIYAIGVLAALFTAAGFIFQDPILGFIAGLQLAGNKMVAIGDWIQMDSYGADGTVREITMATVKVNNWDNTVTTVPTHAMVSDSFRNWRRMSEVGGRRIKRAIYVDMHTVRSCTPEILAATAELRRAGMSEIDVQRSTSADGEGEPQPISAELPATNLGLLRQYLTGYLRGHPQLRQDMTLMVRQLEPSENGMPLEVLCYSRVTDFVAYEGIQAEIFEHILAVVPLFGLRVYQRQRSGDYHDQPPVPQEQSPEV